MDLLVCGEDLQPNVHTFPTKSLVQLWMNGDKKADAECSFPISQG